MLNTSAVTQCQQNFNSLPHAEVDRGPVRTRTRER